MSHQTQTALDCEVVEGAPDFLVVDRASCEHRHYPLAFLAGLIPALIIASAILSLMKAGG
jgi:hypothetical protein